jgi:hypothetical protein
MQIRRLADMLPGGLHHEYGFSCECGCGRPCDVQPPRRASFTLALWGTFSPAMRAAPEPVQRGPFRRLLDVDPAA